MRSAPAVLLIALAAACAGAPKDEPTPGVAPSAVLPEEVADERAARAELALAAAEAAWREGDALSAFAIANRALRDSPPDESAKLLREVRSRARAALVGEQILEARVIPTRDAVTNGSRVAADVALTNRSQAPLSIPRAESGSSTALLQLSVIRDDIDLWGNTRTTQAAVRVELPSDLLLAPGGTARIPVEIPEGLATFTHQGFAVLRIGGLLRPVVLRVGEGEFFDTVPLAEARIRVFLENYEQLADDPLGSLRKSVEKRSPPHILTAAELLPPGDRGEAVALLEKAVRDDPPLSFVLEAALGRLRAFDGDLPR